MSAPNLFIVYVTDVTESTAFYSTAFEIEPRFTSPRFVEFEVAPGVGLALWSGHASAVAPDAVRTSEVCLNLPGGPGEIDAQFRHWQQLGIEILQPPHDDVFGRTFVARDPDGNLLRVAPVDPA
ncbi:glyoxalase [Arsenicicoccus piscis]|uniref:Drug:proton antiporter n=1 Tax=Arsenicicoccus piscis TaxID=673954 RepID=A0ABQ6HL95_9MICO|nr:VOC family protein [Arsenicicoccus piscis]MCH8627153.1 glyoxalase [Arsenicicoccus piscis]GMA18890.1 drug:proton antiporter [Arsenicicoccus piscis]